MPKLNLTLLLIGSSVALTTAFLGGYLVRDASPTGEKVNDGFEIPLKDELHSFEEAGRAYDCPIGHLAPCENKNADYILQIHAEAKGKRINSWSQGFCFNDGTNVDVESLMYQDNYSCAAGPTGGCSGSVRLLESSTDHVSVLPSWNISWDGNVGEFRTTLLVQPNSQGKIKLRGDKSIVWKMKPNAE